MRMWENGACHGVVIRYRDDTHPSFLASHENVRQHMQSLPPMNFKEIVEGGWSYSLALPFDL